MQKKIEESNVLQSSHDTHPTTQIPTQRRFTGIDITILALTLWAAGSFINEITNTIATIPVALDTVSDVPNAQGIEVATSNGQVALSESHSTALLSIPQTGVLLMTLILRAAVLTRRYLPHRAPRPGVLLIAAAVIPIAAMYSIDAASLSLYDITVAPSIRTELLLPSGILLGMGLLQFRGNAEPPLAAN